MNAPSPTNSISSAAAASDAPPLRGLTSDEAERRIAQFGPNELRPAKRGSAVVQILQLFANPLVVILLLAAGVSAGVGEGASAAIITSVVLLGIAVNAVQTYHSQRAIERLRESVAPTATVLRDGAWTEMPRRSWCPAIRFVFRPATWCPPTRGY